MMKIFKNLKKEMKEKLDFYEQLDILFSSGKYLEINPYGVNKLTGLNGYVII